MKKRTLSVVLAIVLTFALTVPTFATTYSDLTNHWAKAYMEDLAGKGFLTGYTDGTMKPDKNINAGETLVVLSRLYTLTDLESNLIQTDYESTVKGLVSSDLSWAYKYLEVCLAAGIITQTELKSINLTGDIKKEQLSVFLVRAMKLTSDAAKLESTVLPFTDVAKISTDCFGSVAELYTIGILTGDASKNVNPQSSVTRAVAAAVVSRALTYLDTNKITLDIADYTGVTQEVGVIDTISGTTIDILGFDGLTKEFVASSDTNVTVNNVSKSLSSVYAGCYAQIVLKDGIVSRVLIESNSTVKWVQGKLTTMTINSTNYAISLKNLETSAVKSYLIPSTATVKRNGVTATSVSSFSNGDYVMLKCVNDVVTAVYGVTGENELNGTISTITLGSTISLRITGNNGAIYCFQLDIANLPTIKRGGTKITIDRLKAGNKVSVLLEDGDVTLIDSDSDGKTISGDLTSTTTTSSGTVWVITTNGVATTYTLDDAVSVYNGTTEISLSDVSVGDKVTVAVYDTTITEVNVVNPSTSSSKVSGTVMVVDTTNKKITILTSANKLVYVNTTSLGSVVQASTGGTTSVSYIDEKDTITAYGYYSDTKTFYAKSIVIE